eukprot:5904816-Pleurochrysis_carterae.AAC.1
MRPERAIVNVSSQLSTEVYRLNCDQGWEPHKLVRRNRNLYVYCRYEGYYLFDERNDAILDYMQADRSSPHTPDPGVFQWPMPYAAPYGASCIWLWS